MKDRAGDPWLTLRLGLLLDIEKERLVYEAALISVQWLGPVHLIFQS